MSANKDLNKTTTPPAIWCGCCKHQPNSKADSRKSPVNADGMVIDAVGPEKKRYHIHKALLTHHSEYFCRALNGPWTEANTGIVTFVDVHTPEFNLFVHWLYNQHLPNCELGDDLKAWDPIVDPEQTFGSTSPPVLTLIKAYTLGDRLLAEGFRHATNGHLVSKAFRIKFDPHYLRSSIEWAFGNIPGDKPILQFLANKFYDDWQPDFDDMYDIDAFANLPGKFVARALRRFALMRSRTTKANVDVCYIEHATATGEESCPKKHCSHDEEYDYSYS